MATKERFYTADDLMALPDDGKRHELVQGELVEMPTPNHAHALLSTRLLARLAIFVEEHDLGSVTGSDGGYLLYTDPKTGRETVRVPDVAFVTKVRKATSLDKIYNGAPDLAVEIVSPSETFKTLRAKLRDYFNYGTQVVWFVYPEARIVEVYTSADGDPMTLDRDAVLDGGSLLPGFRMKVRVLFAVLD